MKTTTQTSAARDAGQMDFGTLRAIRDNALDESGIGHDFADRLGKQTEEIVKFCADLQKRILGQAVYNLTTNVPCGVECDASAMGAIKTALAGAVGALVQWDIIAALEIAADIAEDVNAHGEAKQIRDMASAVGA